MAKDLTRYQQGIVRRYYENKETLMTQKVSEIVSDLYVCTDVKKAGRLWERACKALLNAGADKLTVEKVCEKRDLKWLAEIVSDLF